MVGIEHVPTTWTGGLGGTEGGGWDEPGEVIPKSLDVLEESQNGRCPMELAVAAAESTVGEDAAPWLADGGGANEVLWLLRGKAEEDILDELLQ